MLFFYFNFKYTLMYLLSNVNIKTSRWSQDFSIFIIFINYYYTSLLHFSLYGICLFQVLLYVSCNIVHYFLSHHCHFWSFLLNSQITACIVVYVRVVRRPASKAVRTIREL